jgi:hypothetical protein
MSVGVELVEVVSGLPAISTACLYFRGSFDKQIADSLVMQDWQVVARCIGFVQFRMYSYADLATPTAAMAATGLDQLKVLLIIRSPSLRAKRFSSGTRQFSKTIELF